MRALLATSLVLLGGGLFIGTAAVVAQDATPEQLANWHQWRGPLATGFSPTATPPLVWSESQNLKWKAAIPGAGKSTPIIWNDRIFLTAAINSNKVVPTAAKPEDQPERRFGIKFPNTLYQYQVICLDRQTGKIVWQKTAVEELPNEGHHGDNSYASASAITDGQRVYVSFGSRGLYAYDLDGNLQWQRKLGNVETRFSFGEGSSPSVHDDVVILVRDNETASEILAIDAQSGELLWEAKRDEISAWATPLITEFEGRTQVITNASRRVTSYDLKTGEIIWECGGQVTNVTPSPVRYENSVICMSGYQGSIAVSIPLSSKGDITGSDQVAWKFTRDTPYVPSPLLYGDIVYFNKLNSAIFTGLNAKSGQPVLETTRLPELSNIYASPVGAAGRIYVVGRDGTTLVLKQGATLDVLATNRLEDNIDASPALAGKQLFLRGKSHLYCFEE